MKATQLLMTLLLLSYISACSKHSSAPTEADARAALEQEIKDFSQGCIRLVEFHKTGERELGTVRLVDAGARIEFLEDCDWPFNTMVLALKVVPGTTPNARKGEQRDVHLTLQFHKTGGVWKATQKQEAGSQGPR